MEASFYKDSVNNYLANIPAFAEYERSDGSFHSRPYVLASSAIEALGVMIEPTLLPEGTQIANVRARVLAYINTCPVVDGRSMLLQENE